jgi:ABC-type branched-subunit amino acid transport system permease subunit
VLYQKRGDVNVPIANALVPASNTRAQLIKWIVGLLVPVAVFTFVWNGELIINQSLLSLLGLGSVSDISILIQLGIFIVIFYATVIALAGYLVAADSGQRGMIELWIDIAVFVLIPLLLVIGQGLIIGLTLCALVWSVYFLVRRRVYKALHYTPPPLQKLNVLDADQRAELKKRAIMGGLWYSVALAVVWLIADLIFFALGQLPTILLVWVAVRTLILPVAGYFLGRLSGAMALRRILAPKNSGNGEGKINGARRNAKKRRQVETLSTTRVREEARDLVPNDLPLRSAGAQRFYLILLVAFVLFYPILDPFLFGPGTDGRLAGYGDAGYYVILALGLNIVVGFAGLLDLGYVAFFAIGSYAWGLIGSTQFTTLTGIQIIPQIWSWLFWPMVFGAALIAAFWGVVLGAPTLRLRGDYLAIVTLGFGEIVPIVFLEMDKYTNGTNGIVGVYSPAFPGADWLTSTPYYYLILALIALVIFVNIRLRDSRLGRAWIAIREDEIAAASSGVNLVSTKLFAFGTGAFFSGIAGAYHTAKLGGVSPDNFSFGDSVIYLAMVVIGGIGSIPGVIVGALVVYAVNQFLLAQLDSLASDPTNPLFAIHNAIAQVFQGFTFGNIRNLIFGVILVMIMVFRPEGLIPSARRRRELHVTTDEQVELGALDVVPGAPGFESEVRIE